MKLPAFVAESAKQAAIELGEAMQFPAFARITELLEAYEMAILQAGIDDPNTSKDEMKGAVHCSRSLRASMEAARQFWIAQKQDEENEVRRKRAEEAAGPPRGFMGPGSGPIGMS